MWNIFGRGLRLRPFIEREEKKAVKRGLANVGGSCTVTERTAAAAFGLSFRLLTLELRGLKNLLSNNNMISYYCFDFFL